MGNRAWEPITWDRFSSPACCARCPCMEAHHVFSFGVLHVCLVVLTHLPVLDMGPGAYGRVDAMLSMRDICRVLTAQEPTQLGKSRQGSALTIGDAVEAVRFGSAREQLGAFQPEVPPEHSIAEAVEAMRAAETGSVLIPLVSPSAASSAQAFGLFTERDLLKVLAAGPRDLRSVPVNEYMTSAADMIWADADFPVFDALQACRPAARTPRAKQVLWCVGTHALPHPAAPPLRHSSSIARTYATCRSWAWRAAQRWARRCQRARALLTVSHRCYVSVEALRVLPAA